MHEFLSELTSTAGFLPHGHCYLWKPALVWTQVLANAAIGLSYVAISATLGVLVWRVRDIPFKAMAVAFGVFIVSCGFTHFMDVLVIWDPAYWTDGWLRAITALASVGTALLLPPLLPKAEALARGAKAAHQRGLELEKVVDELGTLYDRTRELDRAKTEFFANVSHELRTPLTLILGPVDRLLAAPDLSTDQRRDLDIVARNARTLLKHVNDLLDIAKAEAGRLEVRWASFDAAAHVRRIAVQFETLAAERGMPFTVDARDPVLVEADPDHLERVVLNLLSNAFKFTPPGRAVRVRICTAPASSPGEAARIAIEVADGGPGIRPEDREAVFERFRQLDGGSERAVGGTGLGLSIVRELVQLHAGSIAIESAPEGGASVRVFLPATAPAGVTVSSEARVPSADGALAAQQTLAELDGRGATAEVAAGAYRPTVLVVEDHPDMNRFVRESLVDYHTIGVADGEEALDQLRVETADLVVTDVMMPRMSGERLVSEIRRRPELEGVPVLVLSAKTDDELKSRLLAGGAQDYLTKPFSADELRARARNLIAMKRTRDLLKRELESQQGDLEELAREVTARKRDLATALESMRVARQYAERASEAKSGFLRLVSHELRAPLSTVALQLQILRRDPAATPSPRQQDALERLDRSLGRLTGLVESLLQYARVESGQLTVRVADVDLVSVARAVLDEIRPECETRGITARLETAPDVVPGRTDPELVRLVISNLVSNAVKYTNGTWVAVRIAASPGAHTVEVADPGPGIPPGERLRVFEPFEQGEHAAHKSTSGVGLGLALVREVTRALGGDVILDDGPGGGTMFRVTLPRDAASPVDVPR